MFVEKNKRMYRFRKLFPLYFNSYLAVDAYDFLDTCHEILHNFGFIKFNRVNFTTIQVKGQAKRWWRTYEKSRLAESLPLTWTNFSHLFLETFILLTERETGCMVNLRISTKME